MSRPVAADTPAPPSQPDRHPLPVAVNPPTPPLELVGLARTLPAVPPTEGPPAATQPGRHRLPRPAPLEDFTHFPNGLSPRPYNVVARMPPHPRPAAPPTTHLAPSRAIPLGDPLDLPPYPVPPISEPPIPRAARAPKRRTPPPSLPSFLTSNILPLMPSHPSYPPPGTICGICQDPFHAAHAPVLIVNTKRCHGHMFGYQCLRSSLASGMVNSNKCPLCRTKWFNMDVDELRGLARAWSRVDRAEQRAMELEVPEALDVEKMVNDLMRVFEARAVARTRWQRMMVAVRVVGRCVWVVVKLVFWMFVVACVVICILEILASVDGLPEIVAEVLKIRQ